MSPSPFFYFDPDCGIWIEMHSSD